MRSFLLALSCAASFLGGCNCGAPEPSSGDAAVLGDAGQKLFDGGTADAASVEQIDAQTNAHDAASSADVGLGPCLGSIDLLQLCVTASDCTVLVTAEFMESSQWPFPGCTSTKFGSCEVLDCAASAFDQLPPSQSAGVLTVSGTRIGSIPVSPVSGSYEYKGTSKIWMGGDVLTVSATGDVVTAFGGQSITAPPDIVVTAPVCPSALCGRVSRSAPLLVSWTGAASAGVSLMSMTRETVVTVRCMLDSSPGFVPAEALAKLPSPDGGFVSSLSVRPRQVSHFTVDRWQVELSATGSSSGGVGSFEVSD